MAVNLSRPGSTGPTDDSGISGCSPAIEEVVSKYDETAGRFTKVMNSAGSSNKQMTEALKKDLQIIQGLVHERDAFREIVEHQQKGYATLQSQYLELKGRVEALEKENAQLKATKHDLEGQLEDAAVEEFKTIEEVISSEHANTHTQAVDTQTEALDTQTVAVQTQEEAQFTFTDVAKVIAGIAIGVLAMMII